VREHLHPDAFAGHLVVFASRLRDRINILYWDLDGFAIWSKSWNAPTRLRLAAATTNIGGRSRLKTLGALLSGIDLEHASRRKRYRGAST
jgi:hypothetical protein